MSLLKEKFKFQIKHFLPGLFARLSSLDVRFEKILMVLGLILIGSLLVSNIYSSVTRGVESYSILHNEQLILNELKEENQRLKKDYEYYESSLYRELYARESLNYVQEGQKLFKVERRPDYEFKEPNTDPIVLKDHRFWWVWLISS